jgi:hypothetical protein
MLPMYRPGTTGRRSLAISTAIVTAFATAACGGGDDDRDPDYQGVCVNQTTQERVDDRECNEHRGGGFGFLFFPLGFRYPGIGQRVTSFAGGTAQVPKGHTGVRGGAASTGGVATKAAVKSAVSRGGFGTTSHNNSGSVGG